MAAPCKFAVVSGDETANSLYPVVLKSVSKAPALVKRITELSIFAVSEPTRKTLPSEVVNKSFIILAVASIVFDVKSEYDPANPSEDLMLLSTIKELTCAAKTKSAFEAKTKRIVDTTDESKPAVGTIPFPATPPSNPVSKTPALSNFATLAAVPSEYKT